MRIDYVYIQNFRKLKGCRVDFSRKETIFVGANNSGKTSAMDSLMLFLKKSKRTDLCTTDFTLSNWEAINKIGSDWVKNTGDATNDLAVATWEPYMPSLDVWLKVEDKEIHYVSHIIPTLDWSGGLLGVRLILEPSKIEELYKEYTSAYKSAKSTSNPRSTHSEQGANGNGKPTLNLWPKSMRDFMDKELHKHFKIHAYVLDPSKHNDEVP